MGLIHDPLTRFIAQMVSIVVVSRSLGLLLRRIGQPQVIAEIVAGIVLGPSLLGLLLPGVTATLFPPESIQTLQLVAQLGLILFMFLVGLELDLSLLRGRAHSSVAISHTSIIVPFALGAAIAPLLWDYAGGPSVSHTAFALFLGAAMSITAFPVLARILSERRLLSTPIGAIAIACAAVDDVTAWCLLAFVVATARATGLGAAVVTTVLAVGYIALMFGAVRPLMHRLAARMGERETISANAIAAVLVLLFLSAWSTELIGIHALFGAFLFGAILPKDGGFARRVAERLEDLVLVVLLPLFFAYSGVRTEIGLLDTGEDWLLCGLVIAVACLGKFGGSTVAARLTGLGWRDATAIGVLMNTRGLMELIVLNIGLDLGVISPTLFTMMVLMALVTTFMTTPVLHVIYPPGGVASAPEPAPPLRHAFTVLACVAKPWSGPGLARLAAALGGRDETRLVALTLVPTSTRASFYTGAHDEPAPGPGDAPDAALGPLLATAAEVDLDVHPVAFVSPDPAEDICAVAATARPDLILMGWHKPVVGRSMLGGVVKRVLTEARTDVAILMERDLTAIRRVLVPFQGSPHDRAALELAQRVLRRTGADVTILHVHPPEGSHGLGARQLTEETFQETPDAKVTVRVVVDPSPEDAVLAEAHKGYDLVIAGAGSEWGLEQRVWGLEAERLMRDLRTSLLVVRARAQEQDGDSGSGTTRGGRAG
ncbi:MAG: hypothetical protein AMXMBFR64_18440 [Myxococcales bacterium]